MGVGSLISSLTTMRVLALMTASILVRIFVNSA